jgi:hypothetical protein
MQDFDLPKHNSTDYPLSVAKHLDTVDVENSPLKPHQLYAFNYFVRSNTRGLLYCASMGQGKTMGAAAIIHHMSKTTDRRIVFLAAKSLQNNFLQDYRKYLTLTSNLDDFDLMSSRLRFVSLNSSRMYEGISKLDMTEEQAEFERDLGVLVSRESGKQLANTLLIVDEAHNLFNAISNGSANGLALYDLIMATDDVKVLFLTGTPMINDPFELVPAFNMITGELRFTESPEEFANYFVDQASHSIKNREKFQNRIFGLVSYYGEAYYDRDAPREGFPTRLPVIVERVPMSEFQFGTYSVYRDSEKMEDAQRSKFSKRGRFNEKSSASTTYRVKSRQASNYVFPEYALGPQIDRKSRVKFVDKLTTGDLLDVKYSPKMAKIMVNISKHVGKGIVYSQYVSGEGLAVFAKILEASGYQCYNTAAEEAVSMGAYVSTSSTSTSGTSAAGADAAGTSAASTSTSGTSTTSASGAKKHGKVYAVISGDVDPEVRSRIIQDLNSADNKYGERIHLVLLSGAVAEGISLMHIRHIHIMEPFWNMARLEQVETRGVRYLSHADLPEDERNVQPYIYLSDYPTNTRKELRAEPTTDADLYSKSVIGKRIINSFIVALANSSIDCTHHYPSLPPSIQSTIKCVMCAPTNVPLFHPTLHIDIRQPSPCAQLTMVPVDVKKITHNGTEYYYSMNGIIPTVYYMDPSLRGYIRMPVTHPDFTEVNTRLLAQSGDLVLDF